MIFRPKEVEENNNNPKMNKSMNRRELQIDVIGPVKDTNLMKCKLYIDGRVCIIGMSQYDYEELKREKIFIRDGQTVDSAGVINTTNIFLEKK